MIDFKRRCFVWFERRYDSAVECRSCRRDIAFYTMMKSRRLLGAEREPSRGCKDAFLYGTSMINQAHHRYNQETSYCLSAKPKKGLRTRHLRGVRSNAALVSPKFATSDLLCCVPRPRLVLASPIP